LSVNASLGDESIVFDGDPLRLCQVFGNILTNAAKYSPDRAVIHVSVEKSEDEIVVRIRDEGIGIAARDLLLDGASSANPAVMRRRRETE
jgi:two-component system, sensor histidine kinase